MKRLRSITAVILTFFVCIACLTGCKPDSDNSHSEASKCFTPANMIKIGNHTYYPDYLFERRNINTDPEEYVISCLEEADKGLVEDIFIWGLSESENWGATRAAAVVMKQGILLSNRELSFDYANPKMSREWHDYGKTDYDPPSVELMPEDEIKAIAFEAADKHRSSLRGSEIQGTYLIWADYSGNICYRFTINKFSHVNVDAVTGEILSEEYWDGRYT